MTTADLYERIDSAEPAALAGALRSVLEAVEGLTPAPKPTYGDTDASIRRDQDRAEVADDVLSAVRTALSSPAS